VIAPTDEKTSTARQRGFGVKVAVSNYSFNPSKNKPFR